MLQRSALKPEPINFLKALQSNAFKKFIVVLLIENCCKSRLFFCDLKIFGDVTLQH